MKRVNVSCKAGKPASLRVYQNEAVLHCLCVDSANPNVSDITVRLLDSCGNFTNVPDGFVIVCQIHDSSACSVKLDNPSTNNSYIKGTCIQEDQVHFDLPFINFNCAQSGDFQLEFTLIYKSLIGESISNIVKC